VLNKPEIGNTGEDEGDVTLLGKPELSSIRITAPAATTSSIQPQKVQKAVKAEAGLDMVNAAAKNMQSDAPACNTCGHITIRSGTCYKCLNCGNSMGCS
jgi:ribonucleoside-diphosphate reductase alpha chain